MFYSHLNANLFRERDYKYIGDICNDKKKKL